MKEQIQTPDLVVSDFPWVSDYCRVELRGDSQVGWEAALLLEDPVRKWLLFTKRFCRMNSRRQPCSTHFVVWGGIIIAYLLYWNLSLDFQLYQFPRLAYMAIIIDLPWIVSYLLSKQMKILSRPGKLSLYKCLWKHVHQTGLLKENVPTGIRKVSEWIKCVMG